MRCINKFVIVMALASGVAQAQYTDKQAIADYGGPQEFASRRADLCKQLKDGGAVVLFARTEEPEAAHYREDNDFFYFSGAADLGSILVIDCDHGAAGFLFETEQEARTAQVYGGNLLSLKPEQQKAIGFPAVRSTKDFDGYLTYMTMMAGKTLWMREHYPDSADLAREENAFHHAQQYITPYNAQAPETFAPLRLIRERYPTAKIQDVTPAIDELRNLKRPGEIDVLRRIGKISAEGDMLAIERAHPGEYQYQIEGDATHYFYDHGAQGAAYPAIVSSGGDINTWHYFSNRHVIQANELVVFDYAGSLDQMTMDITRTFNVSGKFTPEQAKWYDVDLECQKAVIALLTPGHTYEEAEAAGKAVFVKYGIGKQWLGYPGHFVGLATHDVQRVAGPIKAGQVVTVEPIVEFVDKQMHYRVEDTILITSGAPEVLSAAVPKERADVEKMVGSMK